MDVMGEETSPPVLDAVDRALGFCPPGVMARRPHNHELCMKFWSEEQRGEWEQPVVKVKLLSEHANMPKTGYPDDAGLDLSSAQVVIIRPGETKRVNLDIAVQLPAGFAAWMTSRSSMIGRGLEVKMTLIDPGYRGELFCLVHNFGSERRVINTRERIAQIVPFRTELATMMLRLSTELDGSFRGENGFGSTGR